MAVRGAPEKGSPWAAERISVPWPRGSSHRAAMCPAEEDGPTGVPYAGFGGFHGPGEKKITKKKEGKERVEKRKERH